MFRSRIGTSRERHYGNIIYYIFSTRKICADTSSMFGDGTLHFAVNHDQEHKSSNVQDSQISGCDKLVERQVVRGLVCGQ